MTPVGHDPTTYGLTSHFGFRRRPIARAFVRWTLSLPSPEVVRHPPSSLYTFRVPPRLGSGLGRSRADRSPNLTGFTRDISVTVLHARSPLLYQLSYGVDYWKATLIETPCPVQPIGIHPVQFQCGDHSNAWFPMH